MWDERGEGVAGDVTIAGWANVTGDGGVEVGRSTLNNESRLVHLKSAKKNS